MQFDGVNNCSLLFQYAPLKRCVISFCAILALILEMVFDISQV